MQRLYNISFIYLNLRMGLLPIHVHQDGPPQEWTRRDAPAGRLYNHTSSSSDVLKENSEDHLQWDASFALTPVETLHATSVQHIFYQFEPEDGTFTNSCHKDSDQ